MRLDVMNTKKKEVLNKIRDEFPILDQKINGEDLIYRITQLQHKNLNLLSMPSKTIMRMIILMYTEVFIL